MTGVRSDDNGATASVQSGFERPLTQYYRVQTTDGWRRTEPTFDVGVENSTELTFSVDGQPVTEQFDPTDHDGLAVDHFADGVERDVTPRVDRGESVEVMCSIDGITESAKVGGPVSWE